MRIRYVAVSASHGLEFDGKAEFGEAFDEAARLHLGPPTIEVSGSEIFIERAVFEHVIDGREDGGGDSADRFLRSASTAQSHELRMQVGGLGARGRPSALNEHGLQPGSSPAQASRPALAGTFVVARTQASPGAQMCSGGEPAHVGANLDRMTWALSSLTPGIVLNCLTASRKQASPASASRSISAMAASSASTCCRCSLSRKRW